MDNYNALLKWLEDCQKGSGSMLDPKFHVQLTSLRDALLNFDLASSIPSIPNIPNTWYGSNLFLPSFKIS